MQTNIPKCAPETLVYLGMEYKANKKVLRITIEEIFSEVCEIFNQPPEMVKSKNRHQKYINCRDIVSYVCSLVTHHTLKEIGEFLGCRDHTTVIHGRDKVKNFLDIKDNRFMQNWTKYTERSIIWGKYISNSKTT